MTVVQCSYVDHKVVVNYDLFYVHISFAGA